MFGRGRPVDATGALTSAARIRVSGDGGGAGALEAAVLATVLIGSGCRKRVLAVVEDLLGRPESYAAAMRFLEVTQNAVSHVQPDLSSDNDIRASLGPRARIAWQSLTQFWDDVRDWADRQTGLPEAPTPQAIAGVENTQLRAHMLTGFRRVDSGRCIGYGHAAIYESRGLGGLPGFSHIDALL